MQTYNIWPLLIPLFLSASEIDSLLRLYPEIEPYLLYEKVRRGYGDVYTAAGRICKRGWDSWPCRAMCSLVAERKPKLLPRLRCRPTLKVLKALYESTGDRGYLIEIARRYPRSRDALKVLELNGVDKTLKLSVMLEHGMYDSLKALADTTKPEEYAFVLLVRWREDGTLPDFKHIRFLPVRYRKRILIKHLVRYLKAEDYDSIKLALLYLVDMGDGKRAYRVMASEVAKPFLKYPSMDLYYALTSTVGEDLEAEGFVWLGIAAYGVHYLEDAYNWFVEARLRADTGDFVWTRATFWLYRITRDERYLNDLRKYNPLSFFSLSLGIKPVWVEGEVWDTSGDLRNYRMGRIVEGIAGYREALKWYVRDVPSLYRRAKDFLEDGNFVAASYLLFKLYEIAPKEGGIPLWWGRMTFPYEPYREEIDSAAKEFGVDPLFLTAIVREESRFKRRARSRAGAMGLAQIMPFNVKKFAREMDERVRNPYDPLTNLRMGAWLLSKDLKVYGSYHLSAASYNAGRGALNRWLCDYAYELLDFHHFLEIIPYTETRRYVRRVMRSYWVYKSLYGGVWEE